ncbi:uncharacterized protein LOC113210854 [Frankliniella occidentalis]|uniref:Uncharacterized protein LOC113210854 n=1 Tax=Frankliniella occidentalis TaxID=133901 RepID=A0A6J1SV87_FRAOC|nr:uncharacterized protein LOC113210854 [Frankliniella occidentalis]
MGDGAPSLAGMPEEVRERVAPGTLASALLLAMRRGEGEHLGEMCVSAAGAVGGLALEDGLDEAWRTACALNLPLSEDMKRFVMSNLLSLRYGLSRADPTSDVPPAPDALVRWHELWGRVDFMLEYSRRLQDELERLQGRERAPGSADHSVMLARVCALALHSVKAAFLATYDKVPWEEMEYLLVMFIEGCTIYPTLAHLVATAPSTAAHLRCFRERLEKYVLVHRAEPDQEAAMRRLKKEPRKERAALLGAVVDSALTDLRKDFALLRDWHSLKEINQTLGVTCEALLSLEDDAWSAWGWLGLRWALFVVGERVKYSWLSPNLSPRWAVLVEAMAPGGVLKVMSTVRDDQEHGEDGSNAKTLALSKMKQSERKKLAEELEKLRNAAFVASCVAGSEMGDNAECGWFETCRGNLAKDSNANCSENLIIDEVIKLLKPAKRLAKEKFQNIVSFSLKLKNFLKLFQKENTFLTTFLRVNMLTLSLRFFVLVAEFALAYVPQILPRVMRLTVSKSTESTIGFQNDLNKITLPTKSSHQLTIIREVIKAISNVTAPLAEFAFLGALRELASRWHEDDIVVPTTVPFSPALFGRQLRNYLNHLDEVFAVNSFLSQTSLTLRQLHAKKENQNTRISKTAFTRFSSPFDLEMLRFLLLGACSVIPLEPNGARPRLRDLRWSRAENERLLRLVELKSDMFRCAREGDLGELQRLVEEDGADVSVRDCQDRTLLHAAAQGGQVHVVRWLLGLGAEAVDPLAKDWREHTALHVAGTAAAAEALLVTVQDRPWLPANDAVVEGRAEVLRVLLGDRRVLNAVLQRGQHLLLLAAIGGRDQVVRLLIEAGMQYKEGGEQTALCAAALCGSVPTVRLLLGATPPPSDGDCWEATQEAAFRGHEQVFCLLLDELRARARKCRWRVQSSPHLSLAVLGAAAGGNDAILLRLLNLCPGAVSWSMADSNESVLHFAAVFDRATITRTLLERGADPFLQVDNGETALDRAAFNSSLDTIDVLVEHIRKRGGGCVRAALGRALCAAAQGGQLHAVECLVRHGADIDALVTTVTHSTTDEVTPLSTAAAMGSSKVVQWLLQQGADPRLGKAPALHAAAMWGHLGVVKLLVPPLHAGDQAQDDPPGCEEPSALSVAVQAGSRKDLQRIFDRFVEHLRPLSSRYTREDRLRDKAEAAAALRRKEKEADKRLRLLQQVDSDGRTALHAAALVSALPIVEYLLEREAELLRRVYSKHKNTGVPRLDGLSVYARDAKGLTALQHGVMMPCAPSVAEALLERMADEMWLALGHKDLREVRGMAVEALEVAATPPDGGPLIRTLCGWVSSKGEGLLGAGGLQDIRRRAVAALGSGQDEEWSRVLVVLLLLREVPLELVAASEAALPPLRRAAALAMSASLRHGARGEMAVQLLCQWLCDLSEDTVHEDKLLGMVSEAVRISEGSDHRLFDLYRSVMADYFLTRR